MTFSILHADHPSISPAGTALQGTNSKANTWFVETQPQNPEKAMVPHSSVLAWRKNSRDGGAWWAAVYGVAQNQTRLKRLSSSSGIYG